jgi:hypothetical protein
MSSAIVVFTASVALDLYKPAATIVHAHVSGCPVGWERWPAFFSYRGKAIDGCRKAKAEDSIVDYLRRGEEMHYVAVCSSGNVDQKDQSCAPRVRYRF